MMSWIDKIMGETFLGNNIKDYLIWISVFIVSLGVIKIFQQVVLKRLKTWAQKTAATLDDFLVELIRSIVMPLTYVGALYLSINMLKLDPGVKKIMDILGMAILTLFAARLASTFLSYAISTYWAKRGKDLAYERSLSGILRVINFLIWALAIFFFLDNLGFKISAVVAGLGIGGVAVALAAQAVLGDLFSYFAILFDRPFEVGDFIIVGDYLGTVEHIGIKTTRICSLGGEQLVFSNTDLTSSRIRNYKRMARRRVVFKIGVTYDTPVEKLRAIPENIKRIIKGVKDTAFDRAHFASYGDFSLNFEVVYYCLSSDYNKYMDIQQMINLDIKEEFEKLGVEFAFPTQTLHVNQACEPSGIK
jgi:small-conductance mechanosensitive channel